MIVPLYTWLPHFFPSDFYCGPNLSLCTHIRLILTRYVQMDNIGSALADVEAWTLVNCLEEGGFPALLWDTLNNFGYTSCPEYSTREVMTTCQLLRCEVKVKIPVCPTNPAWKSGSVRHKGWTYLTLCRRLLLKRSQLFVGSTLMW
jgi:hypothetical protein